MIVLGIETSCDETAAAVVETTGDPARPWRVASSVIASQVEIHREWGGIVPELEDLSLEQLALRQNSSLFEETFGCSVLIRAARAVR